MSALGHNRTFALQSAMSALPPKADIPSRGKGKIGPPTEAGDRRARAARSPVQATAQQRTLFALVRARPDAVVCGLPVHCGPRNAFDPADYVVNDGQLFGAAIVTAEWAAERAKKKRSPTAVRRPSTRPFIWSIDHHLSRILQRDASSCFLAGLVPAISSPNEPIEAESGNVVRKVCQQEPLHKMFCRCNPS